MIKAKCVGGPKDGKDYETNMGFFHCYTTKETFSVHEQLALSAISVVRHFYKYENGVWEYQGCTE